MKPILLSILLLGGCAIQRPTSPSSTIPLKMGRTNAACLVRIDVIPPQAGEGWLWYQVSPVGDCGDGPKWSITPSGASIFVWHLNKSIAYVGGVEGFYTVRAEYELGVGEMSIEIEH